MMRRPALESSVVDGIMAYIASRPGALVRKLHGSGYSTAGDPDLYGAERGRAFAFECKSQTAQGPTDLQVQRLLEWRAAGAIVGAPRTWQARRDLLNGTVIWMPPEPRAVRPPRPPRPPRSPVAVDLGALHEV